MKFYKVTCITDVELGRPWFYSDRPSRAFGNGLFLIPDDASDAFKRGDDETTFRLLAAVADPRHDLADLEACVLETCREWEVRGAVRVRRIENSTYRGCFGELSSVSHAARKLSQALGANEFCTLLQELKCVSEDAIALTSCDRAKATRYSQCLTEELHRMGLSRRKEAPKSETVAAAQPFLPAHYLIEGMNVHEYGPALDKLLSALAAEGRVPSACTITFDLDRIHGLERRHSSEEYFLSCMNDALVESLEGMALVIRYGTFDEGGTFAGYPYQLLTRLLDALGRHPHAVQTVVVIPEGADALKQRIQSRFAVPWVELRRDAAPSVQDMNAAEIHTALEMRARDEGLAPDSQMAALVNERLADRSFSDLGVLYEEWRRDKLTREQFPSYGPVAQRSLACRQAKGESALEQLNALVGLDDVKQRVS